MTTLQIENLPEDLYHYIQSQAIAKNIRLSDVVIQLLKQVSPPAHTDIQVNNSQHSQITAEALTRIRSRPTN